MKPFPHCPKQTSFKEWTCHGPNPQTQVWGPWSHRNTQPRSSSSRQHNHLLPQPQPPGQAHSPSEPWSSLGVKEGTCLLHQQCQKQRPQEVSSGLCIVCQGCLDHMFSFLPLNLFCNGLWKSLICVSACGGANESTECLLYDLSVWYHVVSYLCVKVIPTSCFLKGSM